MENETLKRIILVDGVSGSGKTTVVDCINSLLEDNNIIHANCHIQINKNKSSLKSAFDTAHYYSHLMENCLDIVFNSYKIYNTFCVMDGSFVSDYVYSYLYGNVEEQHVLLSQDMIKNAIQNKMYELFPNVDNLLELLRENFLYIQCECPCSWSSNGNEELTEKIKKEKERFNIIYNGKGGSIQNANIDWMTRYKLETVVWKENGTCEWKSKEQLIDELTKIVK